ncbi:MAG: hypothetical protein ACREBU_07400, partial [Nitrososphaera sp.]
MTRRSERGIRHLRRVRHHMEEYGLPIKKLDESVSQETAAECQGSCPYCYLENRPDLDITINGLLPEQAVLQWRWAAEHEKHKKETGTRSAREEFEALLESMTDEQKNDLEVIRFKEFPVDHFRLQSILLTIPNMVAKHSTFVQQILKMNAVMAVADGKTEEPKEPPVELTEVNGKAKKAEEDDRREFYAQKFTNGTLAEAVIVKGLPMFLTLEGGEPKLKQEIVLPSMILKPIELPGYLNMPYEFQSLEDVKEILEEARKQTFYSLYLRAKGTWHKYIDADENHIVICAADTVFTYFQDKLGLTHYICFVGDNNSGKTNNLRVFKMLGYRAYLDTSITPANLYQFMGSLEEGQGIILEDEADNIDQSPEKMKIYKVGYTTGTPVSRIDTSYGRKQIRFWTFCFKATSAEKSADPVLAKGYNERTLYVQCSPGQPEYDILEVINHSGEAKYKALYDDMLHFRKVLLLFRLLHYDEVIPHVRLTVKMREKQLTESVIRLFRNSEALPEILNSLFYYIDQKRDRKGNTLEAKLFKIVKRLALEKHYLLTNSQIWDSVKAEFPGNDIDKKPLSYESEEFGVISKRQITGILTDRFGATKKKNDDRGFIFVPEQLEKLERVYDVSDQIEIISEERTDRTDKTLLRHIPLNAEDEKPTRGDNNLATHEPEQTLLAPRIVNLTESRSE